jgi:hypothetical protein
LRYRRVREKEEDKTEEDGVGNGTPPRKLKLTPIKTQITTLKLTLQFHLTPKTK